ncbi:hypothetical protein V8G54_037233 [Vigna mungo]|uniref:Cytokinin dehydrogenase 1 FAD/cytokinin binding domain-containing protein n=1 Tax=Vigna mungo TaxID=3915 RepID=A0AAQ3MI66_VIGMU
MGLTRKRVWDKGPTGGTQRDLVGWFGPLGVVKILRVGLIYSTQRVKPWWDPLPSPFLVVRWDTRHSVVLPDSNIFYIIALLRFIPPPPKGPPTELLVQQNHEIIQLCCNRAFDFKLYLPHYQSQENWMRHYGDKWTRFLERKAIFDPFALLAPGQKIFSRIPQPLPIT